jgi:hypothetical protein
MPAFFLFHGAAARPAPPSDRLNPPEPQPQLQLVHLDELGVAFRLLLLFHNSTSIAPSTETRLTLNPHCLLDRTPDASITACEAVIAQSSLLLPLPLLCRKRAFGAFF